MFLLQNAAAEPLGPYVFDQCKPVTGDTLKARVTWAGRQSIERTSGEPLRVAFELKNAKLYAFWIE